MLKEQEILYFLSPYLQDKTIYPLNKVDLYFIIKCGYNFVDIILEYQMAIHLMIDIALMR